MPGRDAYDFAWFRNFAVNEILPKWLENAVTDEGLFLPQLDRQWRRTGKPHGSAVSQSRLLYCFSQGYAMTGEKRYLDTVAAGAQYLLTAFKDSENGGWFHSVAPGGEVLEERKDAYDHAFIIFGLAHANKATKNDAFREGMLEAWDVLQSRFKDEHGGFMRNLSRTFEPNEKKRTQNPTMHLFEALLAATQVAPEMREAAAGVGEFVVSRLVKKDGPVCLPEFFTLTWDELPVPDGGYVDVGHQFEWAFLLDEAVKSGHDASWSSVADQLLDFGMKYGYDRENGGVASSASSSGEVIDAGKGWWEQCELIRALTRHTVDNGRDDLWEPLIQSTAFIKERFVDHEYGGWFSSVASAPTADKPDKGSVWKVDYHGLGMCMEAARHAEA